MYADNLTGLWCSLLVMFLKFPSSVSVDINEFSFLKLDELVVNLLLYNFMALLTCEHALVYVTETYIIFTLLVCFMFILF